MSNIFQGRVSVVTGAGSGIGRALAVELAKRGARLALSDLNAAGLAETAETVSSAGADVHHAVLDVSDREAFARYRDTVLERFGSVNQLFNNAGVAPPNTTFQNTPADVFDRIMAINLDGVLTGTRLFLPDVIASGDGHVVNISSLNGFMAQPHMSPYVTSKFAVRGFSECLRMEMLHENLPVEVTVVLPGGVATQIASNRAAEIEKLPPEKREAARERFKVYQEKLLTMPAETAAQEILSGMERGKRRIVLTSKAKNLDRLVRLLPEGYINIVVRQMKKMFS